MNTIRSVAALLTPLLLGAALAGCGRTDASAAPSSITPVSPNAASSPVPVASTASTAIAQANYTVRNLGPIQFASGGTSATVSNFVTSNSVDRYTFDASAGQPATVNVNSQTGQVQLALIAPDGTPLRFDTTSWAGTLPQDGTYQLEVLNRSMGSQYTVTLDIQQGGAQILNRGAIQFPPGGTFASVNGYLAPQNTDRYTFDASAGQPANLTVNSPDGQVLLTLVDPNGNPLVRYQSGANSWSGTLPASGTYQVDVVNQSGPSRYNLGISITP